MASETRWANAVRALALACAVLAVTAALEGAAVRRVRAELQTLRTERDRAKAGEASDWTRQSIDEFARAVRVLDEFYAEPSEGFGRAGGLCPNGRLDERPIADYALGAFLVARGSGRSVDASLEAMDRAIRQTEAYRAVHPDLAVKPH